MTVVIKSGKIKTVKLSVTEGDRYSGVIFARYALYVMRIDEPMKLKVKKHMKLHINNKGAFDLAKNWSADGKTRHCRIKDHF